MKPDAHDASTQPSNARVDKKDPVRIFISYSHEDKAQQSVIALANRLRADGIDAWIDLYESSPPEGWPKWVENQVAGAKFIVIVCTERYKQRFEMQKTLDAQGMGTREIWEAQVIRQTLYEAMGCNEKVVPVLINEDGREEHIPAPLRMYGHYELPAHYDEMYRRFFGRPPIDPTPIGEQRDTEAANTSRLTAQPIRSKGLPRQWNLLMFLLAWLLGRFRDQRWLVIGTLVSVPMTAVMLWMLLQDYESPSTPASEARPVKGGTLAPAPIAGKGLKAPPPTPSPEPAPIAEEVLDVPTPTVSSIRSKPPGRTAARGSKGGRSRVVELDSAGKSHDVPPKSDTKEVVTFDATTSTNASTSAAGETGKKSKGDLKSPWLP